MSSPSKIRTLILGGGPTALTALHHLSPSLNPVCLSARPSLWTPTYDITAPPKNIPETEVSPMYRSLSTNISKLLMRFNDLRMGEEVPLFPNRGDVERYLNDYERFVIDGLKGSKEFRRGIRVEKIDWKGKGKGWNVTYARIRGDGAGEDRKTEWFSHVVMAAGNYSFPKAIPETPGLEDWLKGGSERISIHSKYFRSPSQFSKSGDPPKRVLLVGSSASGLDISSHFGAASDELIHKPVLRSVRSRPPEKIDGNMGEKSGYWPGNHAIKEVGGIVRFHADGTVEFATGEREPVDVVVWCIGYVFRRPELDLSHGLAKDETLEDVTVETPSGSRFKNFYNHVVFVPDPTLVFLGTPQKVVPFAVTEAQAIYVNSVWTGQTQLPTTEQMREWEKDRLERKGEKGFHWMDGGEDGDYIDHLKDLSNGIGVDWTKRDRWERQNGAIRGEFVKWKVERGKVARTPEELGFEFKTQTAEETEKINQLI
ncbi:hypothetical protein BJ508DRAFT_371428 [Ascobolus immersus RN42]|uniref:FAD/NAD(P)-binding domain-containing protein n=1 Tax=Ascobolus immersus RN42 TaxID=1160509 RepID=A0A3N4IR60_ASCIM|nr:hypothetical protein BJ508DRAFT_371428 [Ascobolus immersus RN42]